MVLWKCAILLSWIERALTQDIMVLGDSYAHKSLDLLATYCPGRSIRNVGVDNSLASEWAKGSCAPKGMCSAPVLFSNAIGSGYKYAWLSVGGNDFMFEGCINFFGRLAGIVKGAIEAVQAAGPPGLKILMTGYCIPPAPLNQVICRSRHNIAELNGAIGQACASIPSCTFVDATGACGGSVSSFSDPTLFADYIHPNEQGYQKIFGMPGVQEFLGCKASGDICTDVRYPYYRDVNGFTVCYSTLSLAQGREGAPCTSWCTTTVAAGDNCNGCCGDMQQRLCHAPASSEFNVTPHVTPTLGRPLNALIAPPSIPPITPIPGTLPSPLTNPGPSSPSTTLRSTASGKPSPVFRLGDEIVTTKDLENWKWGLVIAGIATVVIGFLCGTAMASMCEDGSHEEEPLSRSSSRQSMVE